MPGRPKLVRGHHLDAASRHLAHLPRRTPLRDEDRVREIVTHPYDIPPIPNGGGQRQAGLPPPHRV